MTEGAANLDMLISWLNHVIQGDLDAGVVVFVDDRRFGLDETKIKE